MASLLTIARPGQPLLADEIPTNMADYNDLADYEWLTSDATAALAAELATDAAPLHTAVGRLRDRLSSARTHLLLELVESRRRATAKFTVADHMFFTPLALEQATDEWVAAYKVSRFEETSSPSTSASTFADLCCGIGGDLLALTRLGPVVGVDSNPVMTHLAAANVVATLPAQVAAQVSLNVCDVASFDLSDFAAWHIDPDRRPTGRRTTSLEFSSPNLATLERMLAAAPNAAIKLAPAADVPAEWTDRCELEWISRDRECRQLVAWHGTLAGAPGLRRATILPNAARNLAPRTLVGKPNERLLIAPQVDRFVFDPDPAVMAARLKGTLAAEHGLSAIASGPSYLTGPQPIVDTALACFEVQDVLPFRTRIVAEYLREHHIGRLEIKTRGVEIDPQRLRRESKLLGDESATLLLTAIGRRQVAIIAQRIR